MTTSPISSQLHAGCFLFFSTLFLLFLCFSSHVHPVSCVHPPTSCTSTSCTSTSSTVTNTEQPVNPLIVLFACDRAVHLRQALRSISASCSTLPKLKRPDILVSIDDNPRVARVKQAASRDAFASDIWIHSNDNNHAVDVRTRIALHYKETITKVFSHYQNVTHLLIFEDDLRFSPDSIHFLLSTLPYLTNHHHHHQQHSIVTSSLWNDNTLIQQVTPFNHSQTTVTSFFPGLGWTLSRSLWHNVSSQWPPLSVSHSNESSIVTIGWDYWLRAIFFKYNWFIITPIMSRVLHVSSSHTNVNVNQQTKYFQSMKHAANVKHNQINWTLAMHDDMNITNRIHMLQSFIRSNTLKYIHHLNDIPTGIKPSPEVLYVWLFFRGNYSSIAKQLSLWPTPRGYFYHTLLLNVTLPTNNHLNSHSHSHPYPHAHTILLIDKYRIPSFLSSYITRDTDEDEHGTTSLIANKNQSCTEACRLNGGFKCSKKGLDFLNDCQQITAQFAKLKSDSHCLGCAYETGADLPARVENEATKLKTTGWCLITEDVSKVSCDGQFEWTRRICSCIEPKPKLTATNTVSSATAADITTITTSNKTGTSKITSDATATTTTTATATYEIIHDEL